MKIKGLKELQKQLKNMERSARELEQTDSVSFDELFVSSFMKNHTQVGTFDDFLLAGGFKVESQADFEAIPDEELDQYVSKTTNFKDWQTMLDTAASEYAVRKLGF